LIFKIDKISRGGLKWRAAVQKKMLKRQNLLKKTVKRNQNNLILTVAALGFWRSYFNNLIFFALLDEVLKFHLLIYM
jgi:hypothetical protein